MIARTLFLVGLASLSFVLLIAQEAPSPGVEVEVNGKHYTAPFFEEKVTTVPQQIVEADMETFSQLKTLFMNALNDMIILKKSPLKMIGVPMKAISIIRSSIGNKTRLEKEGIDFKIKDTFIIQNARVYGDLKEYVKQAKTSNEETRISKMKPEELLKEFNEYLDEVKEVVRKSPVGSYMLWRAMAIDGVPISKYTAPYYEWFKNNGFGGALWLADQAMNLLTKFSG